MHVKFTSVYQPQSNGAVERANGIIFTCVKKSLFDQKKGEWVDEVPKVTGLIIQVLQKPQGSHPLLIIWY
jgi:hypothetical protein